MKRTESRQNALCKAGLAAAAAVCFLAPAYPQTGTYPYPSGTGASTGSTSGGRSVGANPNASRSLGGDFPGLDPNFSHRQILSRREDLKKHMVDNAARLLILTRDLQEDLKSREPNDGDAKRLDEIAKLARTVRDEMRQ